MNELQGILLLTEQFLNIKMAKKCDILPSANDTPSTAAKTSCKPVMPLQIYPLTFESDLKFSSKSHLKLRTKYLECCTKSAQEFQNSFAQSAAKLGQREQDLLRKVTINRWTDFTSELSSQYQTAVSTYNLDHDTKLDVKYISGGTVSIENCSSTDLIPDNLSSKKHCDGTTVLLQSFASNPNPTRSQKETLAKVSRIHLIVIYN